MTWPLQNVLSVDWISGFASKPAHTSLLYYILNWILYIEKQIVLISDSFYSFLVSLFLT